MPKMRFPLGRVVSTTGALEALERNQDTPFPYLDRHMRGDWGVVCPEDAAENDLSVKEGFRILSAYDLADKTRIWCLTEADRSVTTILLPDEY